MTQTQLSARSGLMKNDIDITDAVRLRRHSWFLQNRLRIKGALITLMVACANSQH
ncbi:MAG: hypothetical protein H7A33_04600 [Deltaproteobacteria bacterium]|nr:hypothetical protein [Deltaproteobacteria bacterium]